MGVLLRQKPVKLVASVIFRDEKYWEYAWKKLKRLYGLLEPFEKNMPFDYTDYYCKEFGKPLKRKLICFKKLVRKDGISKIKIATNGIEDSCRKDGKRTVNIDPGYVTEAKLVLLTTKDYVHRIYIGGKIFAECTLFFQDGTFNAWPWTYPDYGSKELVEYFNGVREMYMKDIKGLSPARD